MEKYGPPCKLSPRQRQTLFRARMIAVNWIVEFDVAMRQGHNNKVVPAPF